MSGDQDLYTEVYDPYFYYARPEHRTRTGWWMSANLANVTKDDVTCKHCNYVTNYRSYDPRRAFAAHMRKHHRAHWDLAHGRHYIINETPEPDRTINVQ